MVNIIRAAKLRCLSYKNTGDERSSDSSHTGLIPPLVDKSGWTAQDTSKADNDQSDNFMSVSHKQAITAKGADCRRRLPETNTNKHTLQTAPRPTHPPTHTTKQTAQCTRTPTHTHTHTHTHTQRFHRQTQESSHTHFTFTVSLITR